MSLKSLKPSYNTLYGMVWYGMVWQMYIMIVFIIYVGRKIELYYDCFFKYNRTIKAN